MVILCPRPLPPEKWLISRLVKAVFEAIFKAEILQKPLKKAALNNASHY
jgi:hypothetical protein